MIRLIAILLLALPGLAGVMDVTTATPKRAHICVDAGCHARAGRAVSCCDVMAGDHCSGNAAPCPCSCAPFPERGPRPEAPRPLPDRDPLIPGDHTSAGVVPSTEPETGSLCGAGRVFGLFAGLGSSEIRAFLGIWRT